MSAALRELYLGIDVGTQGTKALLYDGATGHVVARASRSYGLIEGLPDGHAEQHPSTWIEAVRGALGDLAAHGDLAREVRGVGVSGQQHGAVLLDAGFGVVRSAKLWCDTSTAAEAAALTAAIGRPTPAGFTAPKLRYIADREPEVWERAARVCLPHDYVNACLTAEFFTEAGDASGTGYLDPVSGRYDARAMDLTAPGLGERVPPLVDTSRVAATVAAASATRFGLAAGTPVSAGGGDNMMSAIGSGAIRPGVVTCSLGTSATIFAFSTHHALDPSGAVAAFRASSVVEAAPGAARGASAGTSSGTPAGPAAGSALPGEPGHLPLLCLMNCTGPLEDLKALTGKTHAELTALAAEVAPGAGGMLFVPFLCGERVPDLPHARGVLSGLGTHSLTAGALYRAALEGVAMNLATGLDRMRSLGISPSEIRLVGGASRNQLWRSILSGAFDCPVVALEEAETAALGAALQACAAVRQTPLSACPPPTLGARTDPDPTLVRHYTAQRERFDSAVRSL